MSSKIPELLDLGTNIVEEEKMCLLQALMYVVCVVQVNALSAEEMRGEMWLFGFAKWGPQAVGLGRWPGKGWNMDSGR